MGIGGCVGVARLRNEDAPRPPETARLTKFSMLRQSAAGPRSYITKN
jgi:hypothetical protein